MIHFPVLRMRRLTVQLRELSIGESISIAAIPTHLDEVSCTKFLRCAVESVKDSTITDPANWTVQERIMAVCHYLAAVSEDGPDFSIGEGHYSDYLDGENDSAVLQEYFEVGEVGGDAWSVRHLTGAMAESIERISGEIEGVSGRLHWLLGGMAAQMVRKDEDILSPADGEGAYDEFLINRIRIFSGYPEGDFIALMSEYAVGCEKLHHLFRIELSHNGIISLPKGGAANNLPPARFPVRACLSRVAHGLVGESNEHGI